MSTKQDILTRRVYIIKPNSELLKKLSTLNDEDCLDFYSQATVVMTEELYFEESLEGWRKQILDKCKERYLHDLLEFEPFNDMELRKNIIGEENNLLTLFDKWWTAEEASYIQIKTDWKK